MSAVGADGGVGAGGVSQTTAALILVPDEIRRHRMRYPSEHVSPAPNYVESDVCV